jgi:hypothetical protein
MAGEINERVGQRRLIGRVFGGKIIKDLRNFIAPASRMGAASRLLGLQ